MDPQLVREYPSLAIERAAPKGHIQWQGTDVCMDVLCECGYLSHFDCEFAHHIKCPSCGQVYECDSYVELHKLDFEPENTKISVSSRERK